jgi:hypothetical protein
LDAPPIAVIRNKIRLILSDRLGVDGNGKVAVFLNVDGFSADGFFGGLGHAESCGKTVAKRQSSTFLSVGRTFSNPVRAASLSFQHPACKMGCI